MPNPTTEAKSAPTPTCRKVLVEQDGAQFTVYHNADHPTRDTDNSCALRTEDVICPDRVSDFDIAGARRARIWFIDYCRQNGLAPTFAAPVQEVA